MTSDHEGAGTGYSLPAEQPGQAASMDLIELRESLRALEAIQLADTGATIGERRINGIRCLEVLPSEVRATLLYMHGGGFRLGVPEIWTGFASRLAVAAGARVILPDYRLAPEHPFPAALRDIMAVYRGLNDETEGQAIILGGDSAGGGLAASLALALESVDAGSPQALVLISPWLDLTATADSYDRCAATDRMFSREAALSGAFGYLVDISPREPLASPLLAESLAAMPSCWICVSGAEVLRDDSTRFALRLGESGKRVELWIEPDLPHVWPIMQPDTIQTEETVASIARFLRRLQHERASAG